MMLKMLFLLFFVNIQEIGAKSDTEIINGFINSRYSTSTNDIRAIKTAVSNLKISDQKYFKSESAKKLWNKLIGIVGIDTAEMRQQTQEVLEDLINNKVLIDISYKTNEGNTLLHLATWLHNLAAMNYILKSNNIEKIIDSKNEHGYTALHIAAYTGSDKITQTLIDAKADPNVTDKQDNTPLHGAANANIVSQLVTAGADIDAKNQYGKTPLHRAVWYERIDATEELIKRHAKLTEKTTLSTESLHGATPLHYAAFRGNNKIIKLLVDAGADINAQDAKNRTPLHIAIYELRTILSRPKIVDTIKYLIDLHADVNIEADFKETPLHYAIDQHNAEIIRYLVNAGADINKEDDYNRTPLHRATNALVHHGKVDDNNTHEVVTCLIGLGADVSRVDKNGKRPLQNNQWILMRMGILNSDSSENTAKINELKTIEQKQITAKKQTLNNAAGSTQAQIKVSDPLTEKLVGVQKSLQTLQMSLSTLSGNLSQLKATL